MKERPLVSIVCMCYNHAKYVVESLNSVVLQTYDTIELIICDDASTDDSPTLIQHWLATKATQIRAIFIKNERNLGNTLTFNTALQNCSGTYILDLACDDYLLPQCIELLVAQFSSSNYSNLGVVFGNVKTIDTNGVFMGNYYPRVQKNNTLTTAPTGNIFIHLLKDNVVPPTAILVKKEVYERLKGYNPSLAYEDLDFWLRSSQHYNYDYVNAVVMVKRELPSALSANFFQNNASGKKLRASTYCIIKNTQKVLTKKSELNAILKRLHYEIAMSFKYGLYGNTVRYLILKFKNHCKQIRAKH